VDTSHGETVEGGWGWAIETLRRLDVTACQPTERGVVSTTEWVVATQCISRYCTATMTVVGGCAKEVIKRVATPEDKLEFGDGSSVAGIGHESGTIMEFIFL
jgi:hypothetical protein